MAFPVGAAIGAGVGVLGGLFGGGGGGPQVTSQRTRTTTSPLNPELLDRIGAGYWQQYRQAGMVDPREYARLQQYRQMQGLLGFGLSRGLEGIGQYFDPYQRAVIGGVQGDFDRQRALATQNVSDLATRAGAFGGSRAEVANQMGLRDIGLNEANVLAGLRSQGWQNALQSLMAERARALGIAQFGLGAEDAFYNNQQQGEFAALGGLGGLAPQYGQKSVQRTRTVGPPPQQQGNIFTNALGGAAIGAGAFPSGAVAPTSYMPYSIPQLQPPANTGGYGYRPPPLYQYNPSWSYALGGQG